MAQTLELRYVPLSQAVEWDWLENPKAHDLGGICESIKRYGYRCPSEYDSTLGSFAQGNGRVKALAWLYRQNPEVRPRYIGETTDGEWAVPVLFGADSDSKAAAQAYALDANNLVLTGADVGLANLVALYDREQLTDILQYLESSETALVSMDAQAMACLTAEDDEQETVRNHGDDVVRWAFEVHFEAPSSERDDLVEMLGPYFAPRSRRKILPDIFEAMVRSYCYREDMTWQP